MTWVIYIYYTAIVLAVVLVGLTAVGSLGLDLDGDGHPDLDHDHGSPGLLSLLGIGQAPLSILMMSYLLCFGVAGVLFVLAGAWLPDFEMYSLAFAACFSVVTTAVFARVLGRFLPTVETYAKNKEDLIGQPGVVITRVSSKSGSADVTDSGGSLHRIPATTISGEIIGGAKVLVVGYDSENSTFVVEQLPN